MPVQTSPWIAYKTPLAEWAMQRLVNRDDARGGYFKKDNEIKRTTRKATDPRWVQIEAALLRHFSATTPDHIVGLHSTARDNTSKWLAFDIDAHTEGQDADVNLKAAIEIARRLEEYELTGHIFSSDGGGGFHVYAFFETPIPTPQVFALAQAVAKNIKCETFPKQAGIATDGFGNWLRVPGKHHTKDHWHKLWTGEGWADDTGTVDAILRIEGETPINLPAGADMTTPAVGTKTEEPYGEGVRVTPSKHILAILNDGVDEGERSNKLALAAMTLAGNGYTRADTEERILLAASRSRPPFPPDEAKAIVASAFSKPRYPIVDGVDFDNPTPTKTTPATTGQPAQLPKKETIRPRISNVVVKRNGGEEKQSRTFARPITEIAEEVAAALDNWPRRVSGLLFAIKDDIGQLPSPDSIYLMKQKDQLFSWMHARADVHWPTSIRKGTYSKQREAISAISRTEFFEYLVATATPQYRAVELLPHCPPFDDTYYVDCHLPTATGEAFEEFVSHFNAETELDRKLMAAALLTPGWGGASGQRPAFLFSSDHGRGSGKSKTAERIMQVWGDKVTIMADKEDWREARSRLMDALSARCVYIDNIKNKLSGPELESLITTPVIDAKKMYVGHFTRPNRLTFFLTANTPRLSNDLTERSIPIKVGKPRWGENFDKWADGFIAKNRAALLADIMAILDAPPVCVIEKANRDRWGNWQDDILGRFDNGNELAKLIIERRPEGDADKDTAEAIRDTLLTHLESQNGYDISKSYAMTHDCMYAILQKGKQIDLKYGIQGMVSFLSNFLGSTGPLCGLFTYREARFRGWLFCPSGTRNPNSRPEIAVPPIL